MILLDTLGRKDIDTKQKNRNIFCLNERGDILWRIQDPNDLRKDGKKSDWPFVGLWVKDDILGATNWNSIAYEVDIETGVLSNGEFTK